MEKQTIYVGRQGAVVRRTSQRLLVCKDGDTLQSLRLREIDRIVLFGNISVTAAALGGLLEDGIDTVLLSYGGRLRGRLAAADSKDVFLRRSQFRLADNASFRLQQSRLVVAGKIRNARAMVLRHQRNHKSEALRSVSHTLRGLKTRALRQPRIEALIGVEGEAARVYFQALGAMVRSEFQFTSRSRRPPKDPVNALLSFGYTMLSGEAEGALAAQGLDPQVGWLHALDYGRPSLALDLIEEFRQPIIDRLVLNIVNRRVLRPEHFVTKGEPGVLLTEEGRELFLGGYESAMDTAFADPNTGITGAFRDVLRRQARIMRDCIVNGCDYTPYRAEC